MSSGVGVVVVVYETLSMVDAAGAALDAAHYAVLLRIEPDELEDLNLADWLGGRDSSA